MNKKIKEMVYVVETRLAIFRNDFRAFLVGGKIKFGKNPRLCLSSKIRVSNGAVFEAGDNFFLGEDCVVNLYPNAKMLVGSDVSFTSHCLVYCALDILVKDRVGFAPFSFMVDFNHSYKLTSLADKRAFFDSEVITIDNDVWVGAHSCILKGVSIGEHSVIGANSTVTRSQPAFSVIVGSPARVVKEFELNE